MAAREEIPALSPREAYDALWRREWGDMQHYGPVHRHNIRRMVELVARLAPESVLDVGCGAGDNLAALKTLVPSLSGVDVSDEALKLAAGRAPAARLLRLDVEQNRLDEQFDLVMSVQVVEHLLDDISALRNMASMSRRWVYISTVQGSMQRSELAIGHVRNYSRVELEAKLRAAGMRVVEMEGWGFPFYSLYRAVAEHLPGGPPTGPMSRVSHVAADLLYALYRFNMPGRGAVLTALAEVS